MKFPSREKVAALREQYKGKRIKIILMNDPQAPPVGTTGTCWDVDDAGNLLMDWDNGSGLNLLPDTDLFQVIDEGA